MTLATAAAVAVASGVSLSVPLNDANNISNQLESTVISFFFKLKINFYLKECIKSIIRRS